MEESYNKGAEMDESYNKNPAGEPAPKTSSTDGKDDPRSTGESQEQNGIGVANMEEKPYYDKLEEAEEYIDEANNRTEAGNDDPVQDGKTTSMSAAMLMGDDDDDDDDDEDDDDDDDGDDPLTIGDDPSETKKKIPVM